MDAGVMPYWMAMVSIDSPDWTMCSWMRSGVGVMVIWGVGDWLVGEGVGVVAVLVGCVGVFVGAVVGVLVEVGLWMMERVGVSRGAMAWGSVIGRSVNRVMVARSRKRRERNGRSGWDVRADMMIYIVTSST